MEERPSVERLVAINLSPMLDLLGHLKSLDAYSHAMHVHVRHTFRPRYAIHRRSICTREIFSNWQLGEISKVAASARFRSYTDASFANIGSDAHRI